MKIIERRGEPIVQPLQGITIELTSEEVNYIKDNVQLNRTYWSASDSSVAYALLEAIKRVKT